MPPSRRRVLVAGTQDVVDTAQALLGGAHDLVAAYSVAEALKEVTGGIDLVLCTVRFDDSRMFDFLGALNAMPAEARAPVICCRVARSAMSAGARRGIELALEALGVAAFIDMHAIEQEEGAAVAEARLRETVKRWLDKERQ